MSCSHAVMKHHRIFQRPTWVKALLSVMWLPLGPRDVVEGGRLDRMRFLQRYIYWSSVLKSFMFGEMAILCY